MKLRMYKLAVLGLMLAAPAGAVSDKAIRIVVAGPLTGAYSDVGGQGALIAAEMAIAEFGGRVAGAPVRLLPVDTGGHPDSAVPGIEAAAARIDLVVTVGSAETAGLVYRHAVANDMVFVHSGAATRGFGTDYCAPASFQWVPGLYAYAAGARDGLADKGLRSWYFLAAREGGSAALQEVLEDVFMISRSKIIGVAEFEPDGHDISPYVRTAVASGADVIAIVEPGAKAIAAIRQAYESGMTPRENRLTVLQLSLSDVRQLGLYVVAGVRAVSPFVWRASAETEAWSWRFHARAGTMPTAVQASVYSAVRHYLQAVGEVGTDNAARVAASMRAQPVNDVYGTGGRIDANGQLVKDMYFVEVQRPHQSRAAWDYFRVVDRFPAARVFPIERVSGCSIN